MDSHDIDNTPHRTTTITETLGSRWKSAEQIAKTYGRSRPWVYAISDRFRLRSISLGPTGKTGVRLFDAVQLEELFERLAEEQKDQPRINPRAKVKAET
jgi:transposase